MQMHHDDHEMNKQLKLKIPVIIIISSKHKTSKKKVAALVKQK